MLMFLTVLTPTYNRARLIKNCYLSLVNQTNKDFEWLIIDDGSTDNTELIIKSFIKEEKIKIIYIKKANGGKHTALNQGFKIAKGELTLILDSDDILINKAVEIIKGNYEKYKANKEIACFSFLKGDLNGSVIGESFPEDGLVSRYIDIMVNLGLKGDKSEVFVTKVLSQNEFPVFDNEKFFGEGYLWLKIGVNYKTVYFNTIIYLSEYLEDGLTNAGRNLRIQCPLGGKELSNEFLRFTIKLKLKLKIKYSLLYVAYSFFAKKNIKEIIICSNAKLLVFLNIFSGYLLYKYWKYKYNV